MVDDVESKAPIGVLLAAGSSLRYGRDKLSVLLDGGCPMAVRSAQHLVAALPNSVAVVRTLDSPLAQQLTQVGCRVIANAHARNGLSSSIASAIRHSNTSTGWVVALADMPWIQPDTITAVADSLLAGASMVAPFFASQRGHPVGFAAHWRDQLLQLSGDQGARTLLAQQTAMLSVLQVEDSGVIADVDTPADLQRRVS